MNRVKLFGFRMRICGLSWCSKYLTFLKPAIDRHNHWFVMAIIYLEIFSCGFYPDCRCFKLLLPLLRYVLSLIPVSAIVDRRQLVMFNCESASPGTPFPFLKLKEGLSYHLSTFVSLLIKASSWTCDLDFITVF